MKPSVRILGVDAAVQSTGVGVIEAAGQKVQAVAFGCIRNAAGLCLSDRLRNLHTEIEAWIERTQPDEIAIEGVFFCRNVKTSLSLGHARGAIMAACGQRAPIYEYSPRRVKQAVCGFGGASKDQVAHMIVHLLALAEAPAADAADALAIALCHWHARSGIQVRDNRV